jgi:RNA polymerase sigma-70 factor (ECF subfamily)
MGSSATCCARATGPAPAPRWHELDPLGYVLRDERANDVRAAFSRLSSDDREVLELRVVGGLNADDVAVVLGKRAGAVRMAQSRPLARLRDELQEVSGVD